MEKATKKITLVTLPLLMYLFLLLDTIRKVRKSERSEHRNNLIPRKKNINYREDSIFGLPFYSNRNENKLIWLYLDSTEIFEEHAIRWKMTLVRPTFEQLIYETTQVTGM